MRTLSLLLAFSLAACAPPDAPPAAPPAVAETAPPLAPIPAPTSTAITVEASVAPLVIEAPLVAPPRPLLTDAGLKLLVDLEVGGERQYVLKYQRPIFPGGGSGVTICIGYDLGFATPEQIRLDWAQHAQLDRLVATAGRTGSAARALVPGLRDVITPLDLCKVVFGQAMVPKYHNLARRAFGAHAFDSLPPFAQDALVSLVFNRGSAMAGPNRVEMRHIRDTCLSPIDVMCIGSQLRVMVRIWIGSEIEQGMRMRRFAEAAHAERKA